MYIIPDQLSDAFGYLYVAQRAVTTYLMHVPLIMRVIDDGEPFTACTHAHYIDFHQSFLNDMTAYRDRAFVLTHEVIHQMLGHPPLMHAWMTAGYVTGREHDNAASITRPFNIGVAQWALDYIVNDMGLAMGLAMPPQALHDKHIGTWRDLEADVYIRLYLKYEQEQQKKSSIQQSSCMAGNDTPSPGDDEGQPQSGQSSGKGTPPNQLLDTTCHDTGTHGNGAHDVVPTDPNQTRGDDTVRRREGVRKFFAASNTRGVGAGDVESLIERVLPEKIDWRTQLRLRLKSVLPGMKKDYSGFDRRIWTLGRVEPARVSRRAGVVVLVWDTSGSIGKKEQSHFAAHTIGLFQQTTPKRLILMELDHGVQRVTDLRHPTELRKFIDPLLRGEAGVRGGGGTDMRVAHKYLKDKDISPDMTIFFTDGYTPFPNDLGTSREVVWVMTTGKKAPEAAGRTIRMWAE